MAESIKLTVNGRTVSVPKGAMVSAAVALAGVDAFRTSVSGQPRGPLCGMGICLECRLTIDGRPHCRSCQIPCRAGMEVQTDGGGEFHAKTPSRGEKNAK